MSHRSADRRQARQGKQARRWAGLTEINKKGAYPRQGAPFETAEHDIFGPTRNAMAEKPSRGGLQAPTA